MHLVRSAVGAQPCRKAGTFCGRLRRGRATGPEPHLLLQARTQGPREPALPERPGPRTHHQGPRPDRHAGSRRPLPVEEPTSLAIFGEFADEGGHRLERGELHVPEQRGDPGRLRAHLARHRHAAKLHRVVVASIHTLRRRNMLSRRGNGTPLAITRDRSIVGQPRARGAIISQGRSLHSAAGSADLPGHQPAVPSWRIPAVPV